MVEKDPRCRSQLRCSRFKLVLIIGVRVIPFLRVSVFFVNPKPFQEYLDFSILMPSFRARGGAREGAKQGEQTSRAHRIGGHRIIASEGHNGHAR